MCYMSRAIRRVGVRELRQNLSVHLRRVRAGHTLEVTERGQPVALLVPLPDADSALSRLIASGRATAPVGDLCDLPPPLRRRRGKPLSRLLEELREERL
jgi:prevent-host-death family protein